MRTLDATTLLQAYAAGVFPMAMARHDPQLYWFDPDPSAIMPLDAFHLPRRLARTVKTGRYRVSADQAFTQVIRCCAAPRPGHPETWINEEIVALYSELHARGNAHSVEVWGRDGLLAGGLYGVSLGAAFFGESMFSFARDASKVALAHLAGWLHEGGFVLLDTQYMTDHLRQFGTTEIARYEYRARLNHAIRQPAHFPARAVAP